MLLEQLSLSGMPYQSDVPEVISDIMALHAAGLIEGDMPQPAWKDHVPGWSGPTVVYRVTKLGLSWSRKHRA